MGRRKIPYRSKMHKVCVVCEGVEEYAYLEKLYNLGVWNSQYQLILKNAKGNGNIPALYQYCYHNKVGEVILIFCDTEKNPYQDYKRIKSEINRFHNRKHIADIIIIFANPCTLQIIIKHWEDIKLASPDKEVNAPLVEECTGVKKYNGKGNKINGVMKKITADNYKDMQRRVLNLSKNYEECGSSNFSVLIKWLGSANCRWIGEINKLL